MNVPKKTNATDETNATLASNGIVNHLSFFFVLSKGLDFLSFWLTLLRASLERHFPKLFVALLFLPFAATVFLLGWMIVNLGSNNL
jgi:hypothetical protein